MSYYSPRYLKQEYFYKTNIIKYRPGWSEQAVQLFLGGPDKKKNDRYKRKGIKRCLYLHERVFKVEKTEEFKKFALDQDRKGGKLGYQRFVN